MRALAVVYAVAFASLGTQISGLVGTNGILPAVDWLRAFSNQLGSERFGLMPTLFWLNASDTALLAVCWIGAGLSILLFFNLAPALLLTALWLLYLSLISVGQDFLSFQWDALLIETGLLASFLAPWKLAPGFTALPLPPAFPLFLVRWLLFRFMLFSGLVKLLSHDPTWSTLTALQFHYQTQPLPSPFAWYLQQAPAWFQTGSCASLLAIELILPFFIFGPAWARRTAFIGFAGLQIAILLSGNHAFLNWLTLALCCVLLDDALFAQALPDPLGLHLRREIPFGRPPWPQLTLTVGSGMLLLGLSFLVVGEQSFGAGTAPRWARPALTYASAWHGVNGYGLFAVMTTTRPEIVIEGSADGTTWLPYEFPAKPGDPAQRPAFHSPHQPRLDWQMWFAALAGAERTPWFQNLLIRLLQGSPEVTALFAKNPFPQRPPRYIRALLYDYRFTEATERAMEGTWWKRQQPSWYYPAISLRIE